MRQAAIICRIGKQSWFDVMGRDPIREPMTIIERALFTACLIELYNHEQSPDDKETSSDDDESSVTESPRLAERGQKVA